MDKEMEKQENMKIARASMATAMKEKVMEREVEYPRATREDAEIVIRNWPNAPKMAAGMLMEKYGPPSEVCPTRLIWYNNSLWKRTTLFRDELPHNFPVAHTDFLMQTINYSVPVDKMCDLATFDGSVLIDRTAGEVSGRCDTEGMNILSLNLMHEIVTGKKTVEEARKVYADNASAFMMNRPAPYVEKLMFSPQTKDTQDLDESMIAGSMVNQMIEKVKDIFK